MPRGLNHYTRGTAALGAHNCKSEFRQDVAIWEKYFSNDTVPGTFVEMGALDGQTDSNTYAYEHGLKWTGVLIEANPVMCQRLYQPGFRLRSTKLCTAISNDSAPLHFQKGTWTTSFGSVQDIRGSMPASYIRGNFANKRHGPGDVWIPSAPLGYLLRTLFTRCAIWSEIRSTSGYLLAYPSSFASPHLAPYVPPCLPPCIPPCLPPLSYLLAYLLI